MNSVSAVVKADSSVETKIKKAAAFCGQAHCSITLFFLPLILMGGRIAGRVVMNLWNMFEK
jgi:hypothetical protein